MRTGTDGDDPEIQTDGGTGKQRNSQSDLGVFTDLEEGDDVQFEATTDDGRTLTVMHHGHVTQILKPSNDQKRIDVAPHRDEDLDLASNVRNRDRLRLRSSESAVTVYSLNHDGGRGYILGTTGGTLSTPDNGGGDGVLLADGGTNACARCDAPVREGECPTESLLTGELFCSHGCALRGSGAGANQ